MAVGPAATIRQDTLMVALESLFYGAPIPTCNVLPSINEFSLRVLLHHHVPIDLSALVCSRVFPKPVAKLTNVMKERWSQIARTENFPGRYSRYVCRRDDAGGSAVGLYFQDPAV